MSWWDKVSNFTTKRPGGGGQPPPGGQGGGRAGSTHWRTWSAVAIAAAVIYVIYSGLLELWATTFLARLLATAVPLDLIFGLMSALSIGASILAMKLFEKDHALAVHGHRVATRVGPAGLVVSAVLLPVTLLVMTLGQSGSLKLAANYLGIKPAANLCQAVDTPSAPVVAPTPHR